MPSKKIVATHVKDIEWIISLWFAIHGGDPAPHEVLTAAEVERAAVGMIRAVAAHLPANQQKGVVAALG
jgi:hypothetical protein